MQHKTIELHQSVTKFIRAHDVFGINKQPNGELDYDAEVQR